MKTHDKIKSVRTVLATANGAFGVIYRLIHKTAGIENAGSGTRHTNEVWGAIGQSNRDNSTFGQWYKTEKGAREHFEHVTAPIVEKLA